MPVFGTRRSGPYYSGLTRWATRNCKPKQFQTKSKNEFVAPPDPLSGYYTPVDSGNRTVTVSHIGNGVYRLTKTGGTDGNWDASAVTSISLPGDFVLRMQQVNATPNAAGAGVTSDPLTNDSYDSIDHIMLYSPGAGDHWSVWENGSMVVGSTFTSDPAWIWRIGTTVGYGLGPDFATARASPLRTVTDTNTLYFDSSLYSANDMLDIQLYDYVAAAYSLVCAAGAFVLTGQAATLKIGMPAAAGSYVLTGNAATLALAMQGVAGSYVITGRTASLLVGRKLAASAGSYVLTGRTIGLLKGSALHAVSGSYALGGQAAALLVGRLLSASAGSYAMTGNAAGLSKGVALAGASGSYVLSGSSASMFASHYLVASPSAYVMTGRAAALSAQHNMTAEGGIYTFYGQPVTLTLVRTVLFHDNAPASTGIESAPAPQTVEVTPVASVGGSTLFALADAIPPPAAFVLQAAIPAAELEE